MTRTQLYLPKSQQDALRALARKEHTTVSEIARRLLNAQLRLGKQAKRTDAHTESFFDFAKRVSKMGRRGPKDLSMNLDHYLYGTPKRHKHIR